MVVDGLKLSMPLSLVAWCHGWHPSARLWPQVFCSGAALARYGPRTLQLGIVHPPVEARYGIVPWRLGSDHPRRRG